MKTIEFFNAERYPDPTAYAALQAIDKKDRKAINSFVHQPKAWVYICSPYRGDTKVNIELAKRYSKAVALEGKMPITPHLLYPQFLDDEDDLERALGLHFGLLLLEKCNELLCCGEYISEGMRKEIDYAKAKGIRITYTNRKALL